MSSGIVDFHTHFFSRTFFDTLAGLSPQPGTDEELLAAVAAKAGLELPTDGVEDHVNRWIRQMDAASVDHMVSFASVPPEVPVLAEAAALADGRLTPFAIVDPIGPKAAPRLRELLQDGPFKGVLLFPAVGHYLMSDPEVHPVLSVIEEAGATAVVHCGLLEVKLRDLLGLPRTQDLAYANPLHIIPAASAFRGAHFVIPHFGAGFFRETLMTGAMTANVSVDTSSSNSWMATQAADLTLTDVFAKTLTVFGPERVLFGTDSCTFPRGWRGDLLAVQREAMTACGLSDADTALVLGGNARRALALE